MKLIMLGTGSAFVTNCYNTCFVLEENGSHFMVDAGGGNTILQRLKEADLNWQDMRHIFVTHKHLDHIMGIVWMMRMITQHMKQNQYEGDAFIYGHDEVIKVLKLMAEMLLPSKEVSFIGKRLHLVELSDGQELSVMGHKCVVFDINSSKAKQFGFVLHYGDHDEKKITCCGDEPYKECEFEYAVNSDWLLHEAFCLSSDADIYKPYEKHHSTAKDAFELAEKLKVKNLVLYHTEDNNIASRKQLYLSEGEGIFTGNAFVPDDLEVIEL